MGGRSSPPEPDYTRERAEFADSKYADRQRQAGEYNAAIGKYNDGLGTLGSDLSALGDQIRNMTIVDDEHFGSRLADLGGYERRFNELQASLFQTPKPTFSRTVHSPYGAVDVGIPALSNANSALANSFSSQLGELRSALSGLEGDRKAEEQRIDRAFSDFNATIGGLDTGLEDLTIADRAGLLATRQQLSGLSSALDGFSSSILGEYSPSSVSGFGPEAMRAMISGLNTQLDDLFAARDAEEGRIRDFRAQKEATLDNYLNQFSGLTIADEAGIDALRRGIDNQQLAVSRFSSELSPSFANLISNFGDLEGRLNLLDQDRDAELARVNSAEAAARQGMSSILSQLSNAEIYDSGLLNQLDLAIDQGRSDINDFDTPLSADFSSVLLGLDDADAQLEALRDQRSKRLAGHQATANDLTSRITDAKLSNENAFRRALEEASRLQGEIGRFRGNDIYSYRDAAQSAIDLANRRLGDLGSERDAIEDAARALLTDARSNRYYNTRQIDTVSDEMEALSGRLTEYGATQAQNEIDELAALLAGERSRLEKAAQTSTSDSDDGRRFIPWAAPWMQQPRNAGLPSSFARQLAVIRA